MLYRTEFESLYLTQKFVCLKERSEEDDEDLDIPMVFTILSPLIIFTFRSISHFSTIEETFSGPLSINRDFECTRVICLRGYLSMISAASSTPTVPKNNSDR